MPNTQKRSISETLRTNCYLSILVVVILAIGVFGLSCSIASTAVPVVVCPKRQAHRSYKIR